MSLYKKRTSHGEVSVLFCQREAPQAGARFGPSVHRAYIIECNVSGYGTITVNGRLFPITPGDCYVLLPGVSAIYTTDKVDPRRGYWCYIDGLPLERHFKSAGITPETPFASREAFPEVVGWMEKMVASWGQEDYGARLLQTACAYGILGALCKGKQSAAKEYLIEKAIGLMETNYSEDLNVTALARQVGMSRAYFSTRFREETGMTPHSYFTALRMQKACLLLEASENYSIEDVAAQVGSDPKNFARQFKQHTGKTPLQYKNALWATHDPQKEEI